MIYALYHSRTETAGLIEESLKQAKLPYREIHLYAGDGLPRETSHLTGLVLMGGPMNVDEVKKYPFLFEEVRLIEKVISDGKPVLGICLGAQLIAKALGEKVFPNRVKELGWHPIELTDNAPYDPVFRSSPEKMNVLHWHGDTFNLPSGAVHLARSGRCENQAYRWGSSVYGLQFHLEVTPSMVHSWVNSTDGEIEIRAAGEDPEVVLRQTPAAYDELVPAAHQIFSNYVNFAFPKTLAVH